MQYWINLIGVAYDHLFPIAAEAELLGFAGLALADHLAVPTLIESPYPGGVRSWTETGDWPDVWVMIGAMAAVTTRLRFVTNVYIVPMRHPLITAKAVGTASVISNGRVVFGAGIGWMVEEFDSAASSFRTRGKSTDEILRILRDAWEMNAWRSKRPRQSPSRDGQRRRRRRNESAGTVRTATGVLTAALAVYNRASAGLCDGRSEVIDEPVTGQLSGFLKGVRLLEQMRRAGHDGDTTFTP